MFCKIIGVVVLALLLAGCAPGAGTSKGDGGVTGSVSGADLSGTYLLQNLECYTTSNAAPTQTVATWSAGTPNEQIQISGNSYTITSTVGACVAIETGTIVFDSSAQTHTLTNRNATTSNHGTCSGTYAPVIQSGASTNQAGWAFSKSNNDVYADYTTYYMFNRNTLWRRKVGVSPQGSPAGWCYEGWVKQ
jgi:hypothetical protein